ncbi:CLIP domain-containing serine protease B14-like [Uranotaenia lowii]|uniref:CLIP domain-containing serine protease B14-like n=1 Tax=Uranotaenia lowii TaxID=190385 RepID=UPI00247974DE|nr:CLIP domain-containing serine protease B14-like [Uranotaenia lowii]
MPKFLEANMFYVKLGLHNRSAPSEHTQVHEVVEVILHPEFNEQIYHHDIALLRLEDDIEYTDYIQPICLWSVQKAEIDNTINSPGSVAGWGTGDFGQKTGMDILQFVSLQLEDRKTCIKSNEKHYKKYLSDDGSQFCAGNKNTSNVCDGDSGGGIFFKLGSSWYIRGLVSSGVKSDKDNHCDPTQYAIFSDVPFYLKWINSHQDKAKQKNLLNLGNCGLDSYDLKVEENKKLLFLQYPWTAILEFQVTGTSRVVAMCNGALIHPRYVLTVGHCVGEASMRLKLKSVRLGEYNLATNPDTETRKRQKITTRIQSIDILEYIKHSNFNNPRYGNNLAILKLKYPADLTKPNVKPICLPVLNDGGNYTITGWKRVGGNSTILQREKVSLDSFADCQVKYRKLKILLKNDNNLLCGSYHLEKQKDCSYFMGGAPLQYVKNVDRKNRYFLKGIYSVGYSSCENSMSNMFMNVLSYNNWITSVLKDDL